MAFLFFQWHFQWHTGSLLKADSDVNTGAAKGKVNGFDSRDRVDN
jgi:hypothetical protein